MLESRDFSREAAAYAARALLLELNATPQLKGYDYVTEGVCLILEDRHILHYMTSRLYPAIGKTYDASWLQVERSIRTLVSRIWDRARLAALERYFGSCAHKPTNGEFLSIVAYQVSLRLGWDKPEGGWSRDDRLAG